MNEPDNRSAMDRRALLGLGAAASAGAAASLLPRHDGMLGGPSERITTALPWRDGQTDAPETARGGAGYRFLTDAEARFLTAAADRLIPPDETGPSASQAGVVTFLDRQLAGEYGQGAHFYLEGPWAKGTDSQGYQSRFAPAQFYRHAIAAIGKAVGDAHGGRAFHDLDAPTQDALLHAMEKGDLALEGPVASKAFFKQFQQNVLEGYFSDPIYGGNRDGSAWKMIGFPGAHYDYSEWVTAHGRRVPVETVGLRGRAGWSRG